MNIVHVVTGFDVEFPGGITNYVRTLASSQISAGHQVTVIDSSARARKHPDGYFITPYTGSVKPFTLSMRDDSGGTERLLAILASLDAHLVHFHLTVGVGTDFYDKAVGSGIPFVVSLHDYYHICPRITLTDYRARTCGGPSDDKCRICVGRLDQVDLLYKAARRTNITLPRISSNRVLDRNRVHARFLEAAEAVIPVSRRVQELAQAVAPSANYRLMHIGSATAVMSRPVRTASDSLRVRFIGVLSKHKGAELLIEIARRITRPDVEFHVHGRYESPWDRRAAAVGVKLHGPYVPSDLPLIAASTDLGAVLPVWEDNGPQVAMEFINLGVHVLATRMGGIPDFVDDSTGLLISPDDAGIGAAVDYINGVEIDELRRTAAKFPRLTSPAAHSAAILELYRTTLESKRGTA